MKKLTKIVFTFAIIGLVYVVNWIFSLTFRIVRWILSGGLLE